MNPTIRVALVGDHDPAITAHRAIPRALELAAAPAECRAEPAWLGSAALAASTAALHDVHAIWCVPGSPYENMDGALAAIRFARERGVPFLGTCGGFQHALIEYARNVLGLAEADHAESNPDAALPLIAPLACSLAETSATIELFAGSRIRAIYGQPSIHEGFNCNFGVNPAYAELLRGGRLHITAADAAGDARAVELDDHPFFLATLFQPERAACASTRRWRWRCYAPHRSTAMDETERRVDAIGLDGLLVLWASFAIMDGTPESSVQQRGQWMRANGLEVDTGADFPALQHHPQASWEVERARRQAWLARWRGPGRAQLIFNGHTDVVPAGELANWRTRRSRHRGRWARLRARRGGYEGGCAARW